VELGIRLLRDLRFAAIPNWESSFPNWNGDYIFVTRGLLVLMGHEAELVSVLDMP
jgi:hypothetical protein